MGPASSARLLVAVAALLGAAGCDVVFGIRAGRPRPGGDGGGGADGGSGGHGADGSGGGRDTLDVAGSIALDTTWTRSRPPRLRAPVVVEAGATLTIEPGTTVVAERGTLLAVRPGARLVANGTPEAPIVLTSAQSPRSPGDWGGLVLCGNARISRSGPGGTMTPTSAPSALNLVCGGDDDDDDSGELSYARIEFAGQDIRIDENIAGLELIGVGRRTSIHHVEVLHFVDDGVYLLGGTVGLKHVLAVGGNDDSFDWEKGWRGKGQFLAALRTTSPFHGSGIEGDDGEDGDEDPALASSPTLYNVTLLGSLDAEADGAGIELGSGTRGRLHNVLVADFKSAGIEVVDQATLDNTVSGQLEMTHSIFANVNDFCDPDAGDPEACDEEVWLTAPARQNRQETSRTLGIRSRLWRAPDLSLEPGSAGLTDALQPPEDDPFFDGDARFVGACGEACPDFEGWTAFPYD
ncbi:hypothetical protein ACMHYB_16385 [Sorangium sp. So ce1128]